MLFTLNLCMSTVTEKFKDIFEKKNLLFLDKGLGKGQPSKTQLLDNNHLTLAKHHRKIFQPHPCQQRLSEKPTLPLLPNWNKAGTVLPSPLLGYCQRRPTRDLELSSTPGTNQVPMGHLTPKPMLLPSHYDV